MAKPAFFLREREEVEKGSHKPRFAFIASVGTDIRIKAKHVRKKEIEQIAEYIGAEIIYVQGNQDHKDEEVEIETQG
jgi:predicted phosphodiesterase